MFAETDDPEQAVAAADKLVPPPAPPPLGVTSAEATESLKRLTDHRQSWQVERAALRKRLQELEKKELAKAAKRAETITVLVPNPDAAPLVASVVGRHDPLIIDTANRWIEVTLSPHELREAAMRKAGLLDPSRTGYELLRRQELCPACQQMRQRAIEMIR